MSSCDTDVGRDSGSCVEGDQIHHEVELHGFTVSVHTVNVELAFTRPASDELPTEQISEFDDRHISDGLIRDRLVGEFFSHL